MFFLDNEGTLAPDDERRAAATAGAPTAINVDELNAHGAAPSSQVLQTLSRLSKDPRNHVIILSGRSKKVLTQWFRISNDIVAVDSAASLDVVCGSSQRTSEAALQSVCSDRDGDRDRDKEKKDKDLFSLSGRPPLGERFGIAAEHGFYYRLPTISGGTWKNIGVEENVAWKPIAYELMFQYVKPHAELFH